MTRILDPTLSRGSQPGKRRAAARPPRLAGPTLGLLANGKTHGMAFLERVAEHLCERHGSRRIAAGHQEKRQRSRPTSRTRTPGQPCAAVITAIGD